jgi:hypothetical protein
MAFPQGWRAWVVMLTMPARPEARSVRHVTPRRDHVTRFNAEGGPRAGVSFMIVASLRGYLPISGHDHETCAPRAGPLGWAGA